MLTPYYSDADDRIQLFLGDMRELLPGFGQGDLLLADPPYGETSLEWDKWPDGWVKTAAAAARSMWCFGSLRMYLDRGAEFRNAGWKLSQDVVWEKHNGSSSAADRFNRVHELSVHWYQGPWSGIYHQTPTTPDAVARTVRRKFRPPHWGEIGEQSYASYDGGPRLMRSVIPVPSMHGRAIHRTEKPVLILQPLIEYGCPFGGLVIDPFAGSGSTLHAAWLLGRRAIGIELREQDAEKAAKRLAVLSEVSWGLACQQGDRI